MDPVPLNPGVIRSNRKFLKYRLKSTSLGYTAVQYPKWSPEACNMLKSQMFLSLDPNSRTDAHMKIIYGTQL